MTEQRFTSKSALQQEIRRKTWQVNLWKAMEQLSLDDNWKFACDQLEEMRDQALGWLKDRTKSLDEIRYLQGRLSVLEHVLEFQTSPRERIAEHEAHLDSLQKQFKSFDTVARAEGRDPDIDEVVSQLRKDNNPR